MREKTSQDFLKEEFDGVFLEVFPPENLESIIEAWRNEKGDKERLTKEKLENFLVNEREKMSKQLSSLRKHLVDISHRDVEKIKRMTETGSTSRQDAERIVRAASSGDKKIIIDKIHELEDKTRLYQQAFARLHT